MSDIPERHWAESEIPTLVGMGQVVEQEPTVARPPTREEVEQIEDQILHMAFGKAMRTIKIRTLIFVFLAGAMAGFVGLAASLIMLLYRAGAN